MKKILLLILIALSAPAWVCAQLRFGLDLGLDLSHVSFDKAIADSHSRQGFFVGPKVRASLPKIGLGADIALRYAQRSIAIVDDLSSDTRETYKSNQMSYVEVPLNIRWDIGVNSWGIFLATGPQWDWYIGPGSWESVGKFRANFKHSVFSWNVGAGVWLLNRIALGLTYSLPISSQGDYVSSTFNALRNATEKVEMKSYSWKLALDFYF